MPCPRRDFLALTLSAALSIASAGAAEWQVDPAKSVLAVLTHKAGIASGLAHDHLVTAPVAGLALSFDSAAPEATRAALVVAVEALEIDHFAARRAYQARLQELGFGPATLAPVADSDRKKVRQAMLGESQLDALNFPEIRAELLSLVRAAAPRSAFDWTAKLRLSVHGKSVERDLAARFTLAGGQLTAEAWGEFRFSEFGIEPYSAALGAVKNEDRFHLYLALAAEAK